MMPKLAPFLVTSLFAFALVGCSGDKSGTDAAGGSSASAGASSGAGKLSGEIKIDGSSTVYPVVSAMLEDFKKKNPDLKPSANQAGTTAGFQKFVRGEIDIADASRPITSKEDAALKAAGVDYIEVPIAFDGLSIVVNPKNTWATSLTTDELKKAWGPDSTVKKWSDIRPGFPDTPITFYGPNTSHGTFDYFTEAIIKKPGSQRKDYTMVTEYNQLVQGVAKDEGALGYVGYSYYMQNKDTIRAVPVDAGKGPVGPSDETILNGTYSPLSRPLFMYVSKKSYDSNPAVKAFVEYALTEGRPAIKETGYVEMPDDAYNLVKGRVQTETTGTAFASFVPGTKITDVLTPKK